MAVDGSNLVAHPVIECGKCDQPAVIRKMAVTYETSFDVEACEAVHRRIGVKYDAECPNCGYSFSVAVDDPQNDGGSTVSQGALVHTKTGLGPFEQAVVYRKGLRPDHLVIDLESAILPGALRRA
jgi:hypothetical protein